MFFTPSFPLLLFYGYRVVHLISPILSARKFPSGNYSPFKITVAETSLWSLFYINQTSLSRVASEKYDRLRAAIKCFSVGVASSRMRINRLAERELRWWSASWWGFCLFLMDVRDLFEGLGGILKAWLWLGLLCPRQWNTISVQMFKVFGCAGASSPLPFIWVGNALAGTVCFSVSVVWTVDSLIHLSLPPPLRPPPLPLSLLICFLVTGVSKWWAERRTVHRWTLSPRG